MNTKQMKEMYEITRRAVRDELRAVVFDIAATLLGVLMVWSGLSIFLSRPLDTGILIVTALVGLFFGGVGILIIATHGNGTAGSDVTYRLVRYHGHRLRGSVTEEFIELLY